MLAEDAGQPQNRKCRQIPWAKIETPTGDFACSGLRQPHAFCVRFTPKIERKTPKSAEN
jgi:hypothetical protein